MLFSSLEFIFLFLPLTLGIYYISPDRYKNFIIFLAGIVFYAFGEIKLLPILLLTILTTFVFGIFIEKSVKSQKSRIAKILLLLSVLFDLSVLAYFKYFDVFQSFILKRELIGIVLPIGISFYTFQAISYLADLYKGEVRASKSIIDFGAYILLFPQLIAGPIVKYSDIEQQLKSRSFSLSLFACGLRTFIAGLAKKVILANGAGSIFESLIGSESYLGSLLIVFFFGMQIYFDFSGYSDMGVGLGRMLGFELVQNFNYPYISKSVSEFWRRWHISLSSFFKEYVYIPLGGSRCGKLKTLFNICVVWALTGLWHGAALNFVLWGVYFAVLLIFEKLVFASFLSKIHVAFQRIYSLFFIFMGWLIFASDGINIDPSYGMSVFLRIIFPFNVSFATSEELYLFVGAIPFIFILTIGSTPFVRRSYLVLKEKIKPLESILPLCAFIISVAYCVSSGYNPFLYFRF